MVQDSVAFLNCEFLTMNVMTTSMSREKIMQKFHWWCSIHIKKLKIFRSMEVLEPFLQRTWIIQEKWKNHHVEKRFDILQNIGNRRVLQSHTPKGQDHITKNITNKLDTDIKQRKNGRFMTSNGMSMNFCF